MNNPFGGGFNRYNSHGIAKAQNRKKTLRRLLTYLKPYRGQIVLTIFLVVLTGVLELLGPYLSGEAIDIIADSEFQMTPVDISSILRIAAVMILIFVSCSFLQYLSALMMLKISKKIVFRMREDAFRSLIEARVSYFDERSTGDILSVISYDIDTVNTSLTSDIINILSSFFTIVFSLIMMLIIQPILVLIFVVTIPLSFLMTKKLIKKTRTLYSERSRKMGELNGFGEEMVTGIKTIKLYSGEKTVGKRYREKNSSATEAYFQAEYYGCYMGPGVNFFNNISLSLVCISGALLNVYRGFSYGSIAKFVQYSRKFSGPINETANIFTDLQSALSAAERVFALIDCPREDDEGTLPIGEVKGEVVFDDVSFGYSEGIKVIDELNLKVSAGEQVAIVGKTGAGKTTIVQLLMRFYSVRDGTILVDGTNIFEIDRGQLRKSFAMVLQDTWLFEASVYENLIYGNETKTFEEVVEACKASHIHDFILSLKDGYHTILSEGGTHISKGQKQLLTIARAMLSDAKMLILDEATSNVDTRTEIYIQEAMKSLMKGKTCFIIAHRLSTIRHADTILVMDRGKIVEKGNHRALMEKKGVYFRLYQAQFD